MKMQIEHMNRQQKIDLLKQIAKKEISIVNGEVIDHRIFKPLFNRNGQLFEVGKPDPVTFDQFHPLQSFFIFKVIEPSEFKKQ